MPTFEWKGKGRNGQEQTGVLVADSKDAVVAMMRRQQVVVTGVKEKGKEIAVPKFGGRVPPQLIAVFIAGGVLEVYHYGTQHYDFHRTQLTLERA